MWSQLAQELLSARRQGCVIRYQLAAGCQDRIREKQLSHQEFTWRS
jgi:hypothetical protein